jgi:hypothetical protein
MYRESPLFLSNILPRLHISIHPPLQVEWAKPTLRDKEKKDTK